MTELRAHLEAAARLRRARLREDALIQRAAFSAESADFAKLMDDLGA